MDEAFVKLLMKTMESQTTSINAIAADVQEIKTKIAVIEANESKMIENSPYPTKRTRMVDSAAGGSLGGILAAVVYAVVDYFSKST